MNIDLIPKIILRNLSLFVIFLLLANVTGILIKFYFVDDYVYGLIPLFDLSMEMNTPTLYSSFALIVCSILLWLIAIKHKKVVSFYILWMWLAVLFAILSVDEIAEIHECLIDPVSESRNTSGLFYYAWIIPYGIALTVFIALYLRFLVQLPKRTMFLFIISGAVFASGAIGFEMLGGRQVELHGEDNIIYCLFYTCEELF